MAEVGSLMIYLFTYLFISQIPNPATGGSARIDVKGREKEIQARRGKKKRDGEEREKSFSPTRGSEALIGEEEHNEKQKEKKETGGGLPTRLPWTIWSHFMTHRDYTVGLF